MSLHAAIILVLTNVSPLLLLPLFLNVKTSKLLGLPEDTSNRLLSGAWDHDFTLFGIHENAGAYKERVSRSTGIDAPSMNERLEVEALSPRIQAHIKNAGHIYADLLSGRENVYLPREGGDLTILLKNGEGVTLEEINPYLGELLNQVKGRGWQATPVSQRSGMRPFFPFLPCRFLA